VPRASARRALLALTLLGIGAGCRRPVPGTRDPIADVRVFQRPADLAGASHRVLDTIAAPLGERGLSSRWPVALQLAAARLDANAIVLLDTVPRGRDARPHLRAVAIRLAHPYAGAAALCDSLGEPPGRARLQACERAVRADSSDARAWRTLAQLRAQAYDGEGAALAWARVTALAPDDVDAHFQLGCALPSGTRKRAAWRRAAALDRLAMGPRRLLASHLLHERDEPAEALALADTLVLAFDDADAHYLRARALLVLERWDEAGDAARATIARVAPTRGFAARAWGAYAMSHHRRGRHAEAVGAWERALAADGNYFNRMTRDPTDLEGENEAWEASRRSAPAATIAPPVPPAMPRPAMAGARNGRCGA
jgi:tetratricopeptide (TPR) repeat protein